MNLEAARELWENADLYCGTTTRWEIQINREDGFLQGRFFGGRWKDQVLLFVLNGKVFNLKPSDTILWHPVTVIPLRCWKTDQMPTASFMVNGHPCGCSWCKNTPNKPSGRSLFTILQVGGCHVSGLFQLTSVHFQTLNRFAQLLAGASCIWNLEIRTGPIPPISFFCNWLCFSLQLVPWKMNS